MVVWVSRRLQEAGPAELMDGCREGGAAPGSSLSRSPRWGRPLALQQLSVPLPQAARAHCSGPCRPLGWSHTDGGLIGLAELTWGTLWRVSKGYGGHTGSKIS